MKKTVKQVLYSVFILGFICVFNSCATDDNLITPTNPAEKEGYMKIVLNLPEYAIPTKGDTKTRSMDEKAESAISADQLNVLVFKEYNGTKKFYYKAPIVSVEQDATTPNKSTVTVKLVKSTIHGVTTKFDFMFVANYDLPSSLTLEEGTTTKKKLFRQ